MIRFQTLGSLELRSDDSNLYPELLRQPKRLALLAYLAIEYAGRFCRRDTLLGLFWPEQDARSGRNALSQALHVLRRTLGEDVIIGRGQEEIGVNATRLTCDAAEFRALIDTGDTETALAKYAGDLLPGFYVSDAAAFEAWLERRREELRSMAAAAASQLVAEHEQKNELRAAIRWAEQACRLGPNDETALAQLVELVDRNGDRTKALAIYDAFARRLAEELELEPGAETQALVARIKAGGNGKADRVERIAETHAADDGHVEPLTAGRRARPRTSLMYAAALGTIVLASLGLMVTRSRNLAHASTEPTSVAVLPFTVRGDAQHQYLGAGIADLLSAQLSEGRTTRSADAHAVFTLAARQSAAATDPSLAKDIAQRVGAREYILGSIVEAGGRLQIDASLYDIDGKLIRRTHSGAADANDLFELVDELSGGLFATRPGERGSELTRVAAATTHSLVALTAFLEGETDFRAGRYAQAVAALQRAVAADSTFALAYYRLAIADIWAGPNSRPAMQQARRFEDHLPWHEKQLVNAGLAWLDGDNTIAEKIYRDIVGRYPDDVEAWNQLIEIWLHTNAARGRDPLEARYAIERVLQLDPQNANALWHLTLLLADGNRVTFDSVTRHALALGPDEEHSFELRVVRAQVLHDPEDLAQLARDLGRGEVSRISTNAMRVAVFAGDPRSALELMTARAFQHDDSTRAEAAERRARYYEALGMLTAARRSIDLLRSLHFGTYALERAYIDLLPYGQVERDELKGAVAALERWNAAADAGRGSKFGYAQREFYVPLRLYYMALLNARMHDTASAARNIEDLAHVQAGDYPRTIASLEQGARAFESFQNGDARASLAQVDSAYREVWYAWAGMFAPHAQAADRYLRAELLSGLGRNEEAVRWYASAEKNSLDDVAYLPLSYYRRAGLYERLGKPADAAREYERFVDLWRDCDPELRPLVRTSQARIAALTR
jgi:DNA-binding SARP family transcriptional activator/TolB-like protein